MADLTVSIDLSAWMDDEGVHTTVYIGETNEPVATVTESYKELIDAMLYSCTCRDVIMPQHYEDIEAFIATLADAAAYAREKFGEMSDDI